MDKMKKFHEKLKIVAIVGLLIITPLVSTSQSQRSSKYHLMIHFILNILIIAVGADAGLLSFFLHPPSPAPTPTIHKTPHHQQDHSMDEEEDDDHDVAALTPPSPPPSPPPQSDNGRTNTPSCPVGPAGDNHKSEDLQGLLRKSPPSDHHPTIFFIHEPAADDDVVQHQQDINYNDGREEKDEDNGDSISGQELYHKAETFIGNFYKQLKMQREHSWNKLHPHATFTLLRNQPSS